MTEELKPCPFGIHKKQRLKMHHRKSRWYESGLYAIKCEICGIRGPYALGEKRAIERWNARTERTCMPTEPERCLHGTDCPAWLCSECGELFEQGTNFCSNCGAKVIEEKGKGNDGE